MSKTDDSIDQTDSEPPASGGLTGDVQRLRTHGSASMKELRDFLAQTRGRNPQEVLGMVAGSQLIRCMITATIGVCLLLVAGSVVPWYFKTAAADKTVAAKPVTPAEQPESTTPAEATSPAAPVEASQPPSATAQPSQADAEKAVNVMGLGDTLPADPKKNPMEKKLDDLLDNL